jgi:phage/plasmid-like protein (TIGR03299 family)
MHEMETMAYNVAEKPWHGLGQPVSNDLSSEEMMVASGTDWSVHEVESFVEFEGSKISTGQKSLIRSTDHKVLTNVGPDWKPVQNKQAFDFFSDYVNEGKMSMETAGSLKGGKTVWALAKVQDSFELFNGDQVDSYLLFSNPHQYGKSVDVRFTPIRVVCQNTLSLSLEQDAKHRVNYGHRTEFDPEQVKIDLGIAGEKMVQYKEMAKFLGSVRYTMDDLIHFYNEIYPTTINPKFPETLTKETLSRNAKQLVELTETQPGAQYAEGSWWQAFNAVTYFTDHEQGRNPENRLQSSWFGGNQRLKTKALEKALEYANV